MSGDEKAGTVPEEAIQTVLWRLDVCSPSIVYSSGADGQTYTRDEMKKEVAAHSATGIDFVNAEIDFLRAQASGELAALLAQ
ncbi:MAG: hypothetical protein RLZZ324_681 [Candidatus Parcubacteria bacterium]|jgi:hypothetical protein